MSSEALSWNEFRSRLKGSRLSIDQKGKLFREYQAGKITIADIIYDTKTGEGEIIAPRSLSRRRSPTRRRSPNRRRSPARRTSPTRRHSPTRRRSPVRNTNKQRSTRSNSNRRRRSPRTLHNDLECNMCKELQSPRTLHNDLECNVCMQMQPKSREYTKTIKTEYTMDNSYEDLSGYTRAQLMGMLKAGDVDRQDVLYYAAMTGDSTLAAAALKYMNTPTNNVDPGRDDFKVFILAAEYGHNAIVDVLLKAMKKEGYDVSRYGKNAFKAVKYMDQQHLKMMDNTLDNGDNAWKYAAAGLGGFVLGGLLF